jgi:hypothetical protein
MLYLKNTLGGLTRSLTGSALLTFQGPHRWWKLALYVVMFVLPGGSLAVLLFAWFDQRREARAARKRAVVPVALPGAPSTIKGTALSTHGPCQARADAMPCRAAAGKLARQTCDARNG